MLKYFLYFSQKIERPNTVNIYAEPEEDLFLRDERLKGGLGGGGGHGGENIYFFSGSASDDKVINKFKEINKNSN